MRFRLFIKSTLGPKSLDEAQKEIELLSQKQAFILHKLKKNKAHFLSTYHKSLDKRPFDSGPSIRIAELHFELLQVCQDAKNAYTDVLWHTWGFFRRSHESMIMESIANIEQEIQGIISIINDICQSLNRGRDKKMQRLSNDLAEKLETLDTRAASLARSERGYELFIDI